MSVSRLPDTPDLNRPLHVPAAIPVRSEVTDVPGNVNLPAAERARRLASALIV